MKKEFDTVEKAFQWFLENIYPSLSTEEKKQIKDAKHDLKRGKTVSEGKMKEILTSQDFKIQVKVLYEKNK